MAAYHLAKGGQNVLLIEKAKIPRYKVCGGGLVWRARKFLPQDIPLQVEREFYQIDWKMTPELEYTVTRDYPLVSMIMRDSFDAGLTEAASRAGAVIHDDEAFLSLEMEAQAIIIQTSRGRYRARHIVAADGVLSSVYRFLELKDLRTKIPAVEAEVLLKDVRDRLFEKVIFDVTAIPRGYGWVFPKAHHLSIGVAAMPSSNASLNQCYSDYMSVLGLNGNVLEVKKYGFQIPLYPHRQLCHGRILFTGDAAGLADPLVAEGISHALFSGKWASDALLTDEENAPERYDRKVREILASQIRSARFLAMLFYDYPGVSRSVMKRKGEYITNYVSDIFAAERRYPDNFSMITKSIRKLF